MHDQKLPTSFNIDGWKRGYNSGIIFASDKVESQNTKKIVNLKPHIQNRPILFKIMVVVKLNEILFRKRCKFKKVDWNQLSKNLDDIISSIKPIPENYDAFNELIKCISRKSIPRGSRTRSISALSPEIINKLIKQIYGNV